MKNLWKQFFLFFVIYFLQRKRQVLWCNQVWCPKIFAQNKRKPQYTLLCPFSKERMFQYYFICNLKVINKKNLINKLLDILIYYTFFFKFCVHLAPHLLRNYKMTPGSYLHFFNYQILVKKTNDFIIPTLFQMVSKLRHFSYLWNSSTLHSLGSFQQIK